jgi:hypothetical protein
MEKPHTWIYDLCDAIEASERERLLEISYANKVGVEQWRNLRHIADAIRVGEGYYTEEELADAVVKAIEAQTRVIENLRASTSEFQTIAYDAITSRNETERRFEAQAAEIEKAWDINKRLASTVDAQMMEIEELRRGLAHKEALVESWRCKCLDAREK